MQLAKMTRNLIGEESENSALESNFQKEKLFDNKKWRKIIGEVCQLLDPVKKRIHAISPFGFELTQNKRYLLGNLKRFYLYVGISDNTISLDSIATEFLDRILNKIKNQNIFDIDDIVLRIEQNRFIKMRSENYTGSPSDKLIDIQCRYVEKSIMDYYCDYIICCLSAINDDKDEPKEFSANKRFRVRTYQLYIMLENLFGYLLPKMTQYENNLFEKIFSRVDNSISIFFNKSELYQVADITDLTIMTELIKKRVVMMIQTLHDDSDIVYVKSHSFHVDDELRITLSKKYYIDAVNKIRKTYFDYT